MRTSLLLLAAGLIGVDLSAQQPAADRDQEHSHSKYELRGDLSAALVSGEFVIFAPEASRSTSLSAGMGMGTSSTASDGAAPQVPGELARARLVEGKFTLAGELEEVVAVHFYVLGAKSVDGRNMAPTKGQAFILEPGELVLTMNAQHKFSVSGGKYNDAVYNVWKATPEYAEAEERMYRLYREVPGETDEEAKARLEEAQKAQQTVFDLEAAGRRKTATTHPDILARKLAIQTAWLGGPWMLEGARSILALDPEDAWAKQFVADQEAYDAQRARNAETGKVGSAYKDFDAKTLAGTDVSLSDLCKKNKFVLLDFWASWCGPCRNEIPHMKKAYTAYHAKGFEILSFTIDDDRKAWEKASGEEDLPWINAGLGSQSVPKKLYEITGVPANYLIDASTGLVVARNLRGPALDETLGELLGE